VELLLSQGHARDRDQHGNSDGRIAGEERRRDLLRLIHDQEQQEQQERGARMSSLGRGLMEHHLGENVKALNRLSEQFEQLHQRLDTSRVTCPSDEVDSSSSSEAETDDASAPVRKARPSAPWRMLKLAVSAWVLYRVLKFIRRMRGKEPGVGAPLNFVETASSLWENLEGVREYLMEGLQDHLSTRVFILAVTLMMKCLPKKSRFLLDWLTET
jgi:hypothetical protein